MPDETVEECLNTLERLQNNLVKWIRPLKSEYPTIKAQITNMEEKINGYKIRILEYFQAITIKLQIALNDFEIDLIKEKEREQK